MSGKWYIGNMRQLVLLNPTNDILCIHRYTNTKKERDVKITCPMYTPQVRFKN